MDKANGKTNHPSRRVHFLLQKNTGNDERQIMTSKEVVSLTLFARAIRNKVKEGIADTNRTIAKIDSFGKGMREAGQKVANTFRTFAAQKRWITLTRKRNSPR